MAKCISNGLQCVSNSEPISLEKRRTVNNQIEVERGRSILRRVCTFFLSKCCASRDYRPVGAGLHEPAFELRRHGAPSLCSRMVRVDRPILIILAFTPADSVLVFTRNILGLHSTVEQLHSGNIHVFSIIKNIVFHQ